MAVILQLPVQGPAKPAVSPRPVSPATIIMARLLDGWDNTTVSRLMRMTGSHGYVRAELVNHWRCGRVVPTFDEAISLMQIVGRAESLGILASVVA